MVFIVLQVPNGSIVIMNAQPLWTNAHTHILYIDQYIEQIEKDEIDLVGKNEATGNTVHEKRHTVFFIVSSVFVCSGQCSKTTKSPLN